MQRSAVAAYRQLLVAQRNLFMNDLAGMMAARAETRRRFLEHASAPPEQVDSLVAEAIDAAGFIEENVAQTIRNERGNYGEQPPSPAPRPPLPPARPGVRVDACGRPDSACPDWRLPVSCAELRYTKKHLRADEGKPAPLPCNESKVNL